jgi:Skp family chaperone for outer membrane proteins
VRVRQLDTIQKKVIRVAASIAFTGLLVSVVLCGAGARAAATGASINTTLSTIGSVDIQKLLAGYTKKAESESDYEKVVDQYNGAFNAQKANYMLAETDQQTLGTLLLKDNQTPADQAQIKQLEAQSQADAAELAALQQKASPTDADKVRLAALSQEQQASQQILQDVADNYKQQLDAKNQAASDVIAGDIKAAVAAVAQQKGLTVVFDSSLAIYATNDVTALVLAKLNADAK